MSGDNYSRLPIFKDDLSFQDRHERAFKDMRRHLDDDFGGGSVGGGSMFGSSSKPGFSRGGWEWEDDLDRLSRDFYQLKPRAQPRMDDLQREEFGSRESLEDNALKNSYVENPKTKSRMFHTSFDVKDYQANELSVKADGGTLVVEARHEEDNGGHKNVREFSRRIKIPADVDTEKLTSTLSKDGILTIQAPVPPKYTNVAYVSDRKPQDGGSLSYRPGAAAAPIESSQKRYPYTSSSVPTSRTYDSQPSGGYDNQSSRAYDSQSGRAYDSPSSRAYESQPLDTQRRMPPVSQQPIVPPQPQPVRPAAATAKSQPAMSPPAPAPAPPAMPTSPPPLFQAAPPPPVPMDTPTFRACTDGSGDREMELALEVAAPFTPEDVVVKLEGRSLLVEATHEEKTDGKSSKLALSRNFDMTEDLDPGSVEAMLRSDGCLLIKGKIRKSLPKT